MQASKISETTLQPETYRKAFIRDFFPGIQHLRYSFLKYLYATLEDIPDHSDIDLLIDKNDLSLWLESLIAGDGIYKSRIQRTSFATYVEIFFEDGSFLSVDLIYQFKWRTLVFMNPAEVLDQSIKNEEGIKVAMPEHMFEYVILFFSLNDCEVPEKYHTHFLSLNKIIKASIRKYLMNKYEIVLSNKGDFIDLRKKQLDLQNRLTSMPRNKAFSALKHRILYGMDLFKRRNPTITFTGVDGAGKSTILYEFKQLLTEKYRREVVVLRQRPSLLPILSSFKYGKQEAEKRAANTLPRQGTNKNRLSSLLRFLWYFTDYILGQWYIEWKYNRRGKVLLYDRYYYDYIVDSRRANIVLSASWIRRLFAFVFTPEVNILLYASPDLILSRKQELSREDIEGLTERMLGLFSAYDQKYRHSVFLPIENIHLEETLQRIESAYVDSCK
ncbi:MAG: hypothetical protein AAF587_07415 [Bacteroidota bacterium]